MKTGMQKCSFFDDATGTVVQLNSISEEGEIKIKEPLVSLDANGAERFAGHHSLLNITAYDATGYDQLVAWMNAKTPLKFVSYGIEGHILWYRETTITVNKNLYVPPGQTNSFTVKMERKGGDHSGFDGTQIWYGKNLLAGLFGWADANTDDVVDNFTLTQATGTYENSFTTNKQKIACTANGITSLAAILKYPIVDVKIDTFVNIGSANNKVFSMKIDQLDYSTAVLATTTESSLSIVDVTTIASIHAIRMYILPSDFAMVINDIVEFSYPFIGIASAKAEVNY